MYPANFFYEKKVKIFNNSKINQLLLPELLWRMQKFNFAH